MPVFPEPVKAHKYTKLYKFSDMVISSSTREKTIFTMRRTFHLFKRKFGSKCVAVYYSRTSNEFSTIYPSLDGKLHPVH